MSKSGELFLQERENEQSILSLNKASIYERASNISLIVKEGNLDAVTALITVKKNQQLLDEVEKIVRPIAEEQANIQKGGETHFGVKVEQSTIGSKLDYSVCGSPVWQRLAENVEKAKAELKAHEAVLKNTKNGEPLLDPQTGEVYTLLSAPMSSGGRTGLKLTLE